MAAMKFPAKLKEYAKVIREHQREYGKSIRLCSCSQEEMKLYEALGYAEIALQMFSSLNMEVMLYFTDAWTFLENHPMFCGEFVKGLKIEVVKVNPENNQIDDDADKNDKTQVWLEHGPWKNYLDGCAWDINLDSYGDSFEEAIIEMAKRVRRFYYDNGDAKPTSEHYKEDEDE